MTKHQGENRRYGKSQNLILTWCFFSYVDNGSKSVRFLSSFIILQKFRNPHGCKSETKKADKEKGMTFWKSLYIIEEASAR